MRLIFEWHSRRKILRTIEKLFLNSSLLSHKSLKKVELRITDMDSKPEIDYKNLLSNQLSWCNSNKDLILRQAAKLYNIIIKGAAWVELANRCCNFALDEKKCLVYKNS